MCYHCIEILQNRYKKNKNVSIEPVAVGDKVGKSTMSICSITDLSSLSAEFVAFMQHHHSFKWEGTQEVEVTTLDYLIAKYGVPRFCKIDAEGYELEIIKGLSQPVEYLSFEFVSSFMNKAIDCINLSDKLGKALFNYSQYENMNFELKEWVKGSTMLEILSSTFSQVKTGDVYKITFYFPW